MKTTYTATLMSGSTQVVGKNVVQIKITGNDGVGVSHLDPTIEAEMDMGTMKHTTPVASVTDNGGGVYTAEVYYIMATSGSMHWTLKVLDKSGFEIADRIPVTVNGMMTARVSVSSASDQFNNMGTATNRPYFVFIDTVTGTAGSHTIKIFAATRKSMMMHPALVTGLTLANASSTNWNVTSIGIELSIDSGATWITTPTNDGGGKFSFTSVAGLSTAASQDLMFKVTVNGNTIGQGTLKAQIP
ncbi:MAG TPA: FixH family protein [Turneriella sp.]|nr:FixH family protein [Turneriella sp.]